MLAMLLVGPWRQRLAEHRPPARSRVTKAALGRASHPNSLSRGSVATLVYGYCDNSN